jgi:glycosyltransferase involved in cell wall biosynthesis
MTVTVLHVIQRLTGGGAARSLRALARYSGRGGVYRHRVISLCPTDPRLAARTASEGTVVLNAPDEEERDRELTECDIAVVHFWNTPELFAFLRRGLPAVRLLLCPHIGGLHAPHVITAALVDLADLVVAASPFSCELAVFRELSAAERAAKVDMILDGADLSRVASANARPHEKFKVGYIGTLCFSKMHPEYVRMSAAIAVPEVRFVICGDPGQARVLQRQAQTLGAQDRFEFRGYVEDIGAVLAELDVFGYPLCADNYSAADLVLQEAMAAGVPPVIFPYGGTQALVWHEQTGLVVRSEAEYRTAVERLYRHPEERRRMGVAARTYALRHFGAANAVRRWHEVYARLLERPRRARALSDVAPGASGAAHFVAALGDAAPEFRISLESSNLHEVLAAERAIAAATPVRCADAGGGIFHYRNHYPRDATLRLWSGLALAGQGQHVRALEEYRAARQLGLEHWRVSWYLARIAAALGATPVARTALEEVMRSAPDFVEARQMLAQRQDDGRGA